MTILEEFLSTDCPACGGVKEKNTAFCRKCFFSLPRGLKADLWRRFGSGFEEAFRRGLSLLTKGQEKLFR
jgi:hypothetical protein